MVYLIKKYLITSVFLAAFLLILFPIFAQEEKTKESKLPVWLEGFKMGGLIRFRPEFRSNYDFDKTKDDVREFVGQKIQLNIEKKFSKDINAKITFQDARVWGGQPGSDDGTANSNDLTKESVDVREAWFQVNNLFGPVSVKIGRQLFNYGSQRMVASLEWATVGRSFDAITFMYDSKWLSSHLWGSIIAEQDSDIAGNNTAVGRKNVSGLSYNCSTTTGICTVKASTTRELDDGYFAGFFNTIKLSKHLHTDLFYLGKYLKWKPLEVTGTLLTGAEITTQDREQQRDNLHNFGIRLTNRTQKDDTAVIPFDWSLEYNYQTGTTGKYVQPSWDYINTKVQMTDRFTGATIQQNVYREKQIYDAFAFAAEAGFTIKKRFRIGAEYNIGSGDPNRTDGSVGTFENFYPLNHAYYGNGDLVSWRNMKGKSINFTANLKKWGSIQLMYWYVVKHKLQDGWYSVGGPIQADQSTESKANARFGNVTDSSGNITSRAVAYLRGRIFREYDIIYNFLYKGIVWQAGYSFMYAGDSVKSVKNNTMIPEEPLYYKFNPRADFAYLMMSYKF
ncbi:MAG: alginate export family protein [Leptospiraceae bacterium]|nr:alginate export family protein [Leptospiraceae bacterium]